MIEFLVGPLVSGTPLAAQLGFTPQELGRLRRRLCIWMDGRPVWTTELTRALDPRDPLFDLGTNHQGFSTAEPDYPGLFVNEPFSRAEAQEFLSRNLRGGNPEGVR